MVCRLWHGLEIHRRKSIQKWKITDKFTNMDMAVITRVASLTDHPYPVDCRFCGDEVKKIGARHKMAGARAKWPVHGTKWLVHGAKWSVHGTKWLVHECKWSWQAKWSVHGAKWLVRSKMVGHFHKMAQNGRCTGGWQNGPRRTKWPVQAQWEQNGRCMHGNKMAGA
ncbi:MAG: hypothetical protein IPH82_16810 [Chloroflexi bacterium]|nr:hypothetical protein [Chloroflexota bacterium]